MRVIQLLPSLAYGDAVGNDTIAIKELLKQAGYKDTKIYAEHVGNGLNQDIAEHISNIPIISDEDVIIYHGSTGTNINKMLPYLKGKKIMRYHNITPPQYFKDYSEAVYNNCKNGLQEMRNLSTTFDYCIAVSQYNKQDLENMGYTCPIDVCPILIPFDDYKKEPSRKIIKKYKDEYYTNILFVGRVAPNKKHEDILRAFTCYQKCYNSSSRLIFAGRYSGMEQYYERLFNYAKELDILDNVIFTNHIKFDEILAWYNVADVFLCMSEHEGFCVPLMEAMYFNVPVIAYDNSAIAETLGGAGVLVDNKEPDKIAWEIHKLIKNKEYSNEIIKAESKRLDYFSYSSVSDIMKNTLINFIEKNKI